MSKKLYLKDSRVRQQLISVKIWRYCVFFLLDSFFSYQTLNVHIHSIICIFNHVSLEFSYSSKLYVSRKVGINLDFGIHSS